MNEALDPTGSYNVAARAYHWFLQHEAARSISTPPGQDASQSQVIPPQFVRFPQKFAATHLYSWVERGTVRVKCLAQEHNTASPGQGSNPDHLFPGRAH